jgi:hypothetical protein
MSSVSQQVRAYSVWVKLRLNEKNDDDKGKDVQEFLAELRNGVTFCKCNIENDDDTG